METGQWEQVECGTNAGGSAGERAESWRDSRYASAGREGVEVERRGAEGREESERREKLEAIGGHKEATLVTDRHTDKQTDTHTHRQTDRLEK